MTQVPHFLDQRAYLSPDRPAVLTNDTIWTFSDLRKMALMARDDLVQRGVKPGQTVSLLVGNRPLSMALIHALTYLRAVVVLLNTRLAPRELVDQVNQAQSPWLFYDSQFRDRATEILSGVKAQLGLQAVGLEDLFARSEARSSGGPSRESIDLDDDQALIYTSGTTGRAKGVRLTYKNHWWSAVGSVLNLGLQEQDRWLLCLPLFHVSGLSVLFRSTIYGIPVVLHDQFDPERVHRDLQRHRVTQISVVATQLERMLDVPGANYPGTLRVVLVGGGPVPGHLLDRALKRGVPVYQTYGLTETASQVVTLSPEYIVRKRGSAGKPLFSAELEIRQGGKVLPFGQVGEILIRGPMVTPGYRIEAGVEGLRLDGGWLRTGDVGHLDEDGFLYVHDRLRDLIISGGENVYPAEIEAVLCEHPQVLDAGVVGTQDPEWGQVPVAFIQVEVGSQLAEAEILAFLRERLAAYKLPKMVYQVDEIPRNAAGKILRRHLVKRLSAGSQDIDED